MLLIDETKLTNGTLMNILSELGYKTDYYRGWTEEEKKEILAKESNDEDREYVKKVLDNQKYIIDFETMFENELPKIIEYLTSNVDIYTLAMLLMFVTGCRVGEIVTIRSEIP